jgi:putative phosphoesterase
MKIGIVSDTHGCLDAWKSVYSRYLSDADLIIHAGDLLYHGPRNAIPAEYNPKGLAEEFNRCPVPIVAACGNCDSEVDSMVIDFPIQSPYAHLFVEGKRIIVNHGHLLTDETRKETAARFRADIFITGHTHIPELAAVNGTIFLNPGSPGMSKRPDKMGTIALFENGVIRIVGIPVGETVESLRV